MKNEKDVYEDTKHRMFMNGLSNTVCIKRRQLVFCITFICNYIARVYVAEQIKIIGQ